MKVALAGNDPVMKEFAIAARKCLDVDVVGLWSNDEAMQAFGRESDNIKVVFETFEALLAHEGVDTVYIALPEAEHVAYGERVLKARKNAVIEKPMALSSADTEALKALAKAEGVYLFESVSNIYYPNFQRLQRIVSDLGTLKDVHLTYATPNPDSLIQLNAYNLHFAYALFGKPMSVHYVARKLEETGGISDEIELQFEGFKCHCVAQKNDLGQSFARIVGEKGHVDFEGPMNVFDAVTFQIQKQKRVFYNSEKDRMVYQIMRFQEIIRRKDLVAQEKLLQQSVGVAEIIEAYV